MAERLTLVKVETQTSNRTDEWDEVAQVWEGRRGEQGEGEDGVRVEEVVRVVEEEGAAGVV